MGYLISVELCHDYWQCALVVHQSAGAIHYNFLFWMVMLPVSAGGQDSFAYVCACVCVCVSVFAYVCVCMCKCVSVCVF